MSLKVANRMTERIRVQLPGGEADGLPTNGEVVDAFAYVIYSPGSERDEDGAAGAPRTRAVIQTWFDARFTTQCEILGLNGQDWRVVGVSPSGMLHDQMRLVCEETAVARV